tara:strand:- start:28 stop:516 length:489 start_codon:yes stop_codon:yes gene_type:complete
MAKAVPRLAVAVVLPTPPLPDVITIVLPVIQHSFTVLEEPPFKEGDMYRTPPDVCDKRAGIDMLRLGGIAAGYADVRPDLNSGRPQAQSHDGRLRIALAASVGKAAEASEDQDVAGGNNLCSGIDVSHHHDITLMPDDFAGTASRLDQQGGVTLALQIAGLL